MEVLLVVLAERRYAIPAANVDEVVPRTRFVPIDGAPPAMAGLMDHRGAFIPVVDGPQLLHAKAAPPMLGSRIVIFRMPVIRREGGELMVRFGLLCDLVTERAQLELEAGAWHAGEEDDRRSVVSAMGRLDHAAIPVIDPQRIVAAQPLVLPGSSGPRSLVLEGTLGSGGAIESAPVGAAPLPWRRETKS